MVPDAKISLAAESQELQQRQASWTLHCAMIPCSFTMLHVQKGCTLLVVNAPTVAYALYRVAAHEVTSKRLSGCCRGTHAYGACSICFALTKIACTFAYSSFHCSTGSGQAYILAITSKSIISQAVLNAAPVTPWQGEPGRAPIVRPFTTSFLSSFLKYNTAEKNVYKSRTPRPELALKQSIIEQYLGSAGSSSQS